MTLCLRAALTVACLGSMACDSDGSVREHADACGSCHTEERDAFATSAHASANSSDLFVALRDEAEATSGTAAVCDVCHQPAERGLDCTTCHAAIGNREAANGSLVIDTLGPVRGPTGAHDEAPHDTVVSAFVQDAQLCGTCHDSTVLPGFDESPYLHWTESPAAEQGDTCQTCHMPDGAHSFQGISQRTDPAAAQDLLSSVLELRADRVGEQITVTLTHTGTGHPVPDGASFLRELWVGLVVDDEPTADRRWLSARLTRDGEPVVSPVLATDVVRHALQPGATRTETFADAPSDTLACVLFRPVRPDLATHLGIEADTSVRRVLCVNP